MFNPLRSLYSGWAWETLRRNKATVHGHEWAKPFSPARGSGLEGIFALGDNHAYFGFPVVSEFRLHGLGVILVKLYSFILHNSQPVCGTESSCAVIGCRTLCSSLSGGTGLKMVRMFWANYEFIIILLFPRKRWRPWLFCIGLGSVVQGTYELRHLSIHFILPPKPWNCRTFWYFYAIVPHWQPVIN